MNSFIASFFAVVILGGCSFAQAQFLWSVSSVTLVENQSVFSAHFGTPLAWPGGSYICRFYDTQSIPLTVQGSYSTTFQAISSLGTFILNNGNPIKTILLRTLLDGECNDQSYTLKIECGTNPTQFSRDFPSLAINVQNIETGAACRDPHLTQKVNGIDENGRKVTKKVCYDLFGKSGDQIELLSDNILGTSMIFELRDDYYIGKAFYSTKLGFFNFTTTTFAPPKSSSNGVSWGKGEFVIGEMNTYPHAVVKQYKDNIVIEYKEEKRSETVRIAKIQQGIGKNYLNILVDKSTTVNDVFDEFHDGIFGFIAKQKYEFYDPVQFSSNAGKKGDLTVVKINGRFVKAFLTGEGSETDRCYSMKLDDLLYPKNVYSFQKSL